MHEFYLQPTKPHWQMPTLELWMHFVRPPVPIAPLTPDQVYLRMLIGAIEALRIGTTFVVDDVRTMGLCRRSISLCHGRRGEGVWRWRPTGQGGGGI